jgi:hypothetical protein
MPTRASRIELGQQRVARLAAELEALIGFLVFSNRLSLCTRLLKDPHGFAMEALD